MPKTTSSDYNGALARAEAAARIRDSAQFVGALRDAFENGYRPVHIPSSWRSLITEAGESLESLSKTNLHNPVRNPTLGNPPYVPMTEYKGRALTSEVYHDYLLRETFKPFGGNPPARWELQKRLGELHSIGVDVHDYNSADAHTLRTFWADVVVAVEGHAKTLIGQGFVEKAKEKYKDNTYA